MSMAFPRISPRFAIPSESSATTDFLEMRRVGTYPSDLLLACLVCYVETQLDKEQAFELKGLWKQGRDRTTTDEFEREIGVRQRENEGVDNAGLQDLLERVELWMRANGAWEVSTDGKAIASLQHLQNALQVNIRVFTSTQDFPTINLGNVLFPDSPASTYPKLSLCICEDVIFLLYPYISPRNCIRLPCGHHTFKHVIDSQVIGEFAVSEEDLRALRVTCQTCSQSSVIQLESRGVQFVVEGGNVPSSCQHQVAPLDRFRCQCNAYQCKECALSRALSASGPYCRNCGTSYLEDIETLADTEKYQWLRPYLSIIIRNRSVKARSDPPTPRHDSFGINTSRPICQLCHKHDTNHSPCPNQDCCLYCLVEEVGKSFGKFECPKCGEDVLSFYEVERKCSKCRKPCRREDMFFLCAHCELQVCPDCVRKTKNKYSQCKVTKLVHKVHVDKIKSLLGHAAKSFQ